MALNVGVVGATGAVGEAFLKIMKERSFPVGNLKLFASKKSLGLEIKFNNKPVKCEVLEQNCFTGLDLVFFSSGDDISKEWAPHAAECGAFAIDNSAAFRMSNEHKLVVPEINSHLLPKPDGPKEVIANPNCSTIQLAVAVAPLVKKFGASRIQVATYQSVSGAGKEGKEELLHQTKNCMDNDSFKPEPQIFPHQIAFNSQPQIGSFNDDGFCSEEVKIMLETRKILEQPKLAVSAFTVRVPTLNGHGEAVWVTLNEDINISEIHSCLNDADGIQLIEHKNETDYPTVISTNEKFPVFVGRVHKDFCDPKTVLMWVVADNLYKGAALNGLQIAEKLFATGIS